MKMTDYVTLKRKCRQKNKLFEDQEFPANDSSLLLPRTSAVSFTWKRPQEIVPDPHFMVQGPENANLKQGLLGNCWFIAAVTSLAATSKFLLETVVPSDQNFVDDYAGIFRFNFWQYGSWREVVVDDRLPTVNGSLTFTTSTTKNEFWGALLEKAYAKLYGNYGAIDGGRINDAMLDFTGGITEIIDLKESFNEEKLSNILEVFWSMETIMGVTIFDPDSQTERRLDTGLYTNHAYSLIRHRKVTHEGKTKMLLLLRNPFGHGEWNGAWSDSDTAWQEITPEERDEHAVQRKDDGEFWMSVEDFIKNFDELELCHLSPDLLMANRESGLIGRKKWTKISFFGSWIKDQFWINPQFSLTLDHTGPCSVVVSLLEIIDKLRPSAEDVHIGFVIFRFKPGVAPPDRLTPENFSEHTPQLVDTSGIFWPYRERAISFVLDPGTYIIVPCTYVPVEAEFYLRIFSAKEVVVCPAEESLGPIRDLMLPQSNLIDSLFQKHRGPDGKVDARGLHKILQEAKREMTGKSDGYSLETCRCLLSLYDPLVTGLLDLTKVKKAWKKIQLWAIAFQEADVNHDNMVSPTELNDLFRKYNFTIDSMALHRVVRRYGDRNGDMEEDDFMQAFFRIFDLYQIFKRKSSKGRISMNLNEWMAATLYS
ncbi:calpain-8-like isoform X2 [Pomacea canaliculata]|uniref:calpain-8-like isoform X2 n=1 Tax=Pomacea canaliculata TaxID=400727 RepID=UPI000D72A350|nr:calpain-8-like isoform X2 [Pomacea canaliculata]